MAEIPETVRTEMKFIYVKNMDDVVKYAYRKSKVPVKGDNIVTQARA